jgi:hypothetical protein
MVEGGGLYSGSIANVLTLGRDNVVKVDVNSDVTRYLVMGHDIFPRSI